jgi:hypothetical protein
MITVNHNKPRKWDNFYTFTVRHVEHVRNPYRSVCIFYTFETTKSDFGKFDSIKAAFENLDFRSSFYVYPVNILEF